MKKLLVSFSLLPTIILILGASTFAQQPKKRPTPKPKVVVTQPKITPVETQDNDKSLTNADVIRMVKAGLGENIILNAIQTNKSQFDVSVNSLLELMNAGVSQKVIETMQSVAAGKRVTSTVSEQVTTKPPKNLPSESSLSNQEETNSLSVTDIGVVVVNGSKRVEMKRSVSDMKFNAKNAMIPFFGKTKIKSALNGSQAQLRIADTTPEFEVKLMAGFGASDQLVLVKVTPKSDRREIEIARGGSLGGSSGFRKEVIVPTTFEEIKTETVAGAMRLTHYRVKVVNPLPPGEYVFVPQIQTYYDFGVDANAQNINSTSQQILQKPVSNPTNTNVAAVSNSQTLNATNTNSVSDTQGLPTYGSVTDIKSFNRIYVFAEDAESRERVIKAFKDAPQFQIVGNPQEAQIILEYKVLSRDSNADRGNKDIRVKSQLSAIYINSGNRVVAWSDTAEYARLTSGGIGFRTQHNESKLTERFIKAMKN